MGHPGLNTKPGLICLAQGHNVVTPVRLEPAAPPSLAKHSTTELLRSLAATFQQCGILTIVAGLRRTCEVFF